ncbi:Oidioi.mRNA.OKI2018_I69.chr2.g7518.t1.cds [Oikopleura dioica]|uniref:Oidioi.mRNA.OKI2018_I69.chr2.g7518.t1.cds n=1 Tax=Oikopleura dioica TaxID=34765 RepID=A0ABN7TD91_OIKDI|nr:Oidioi.mRNA.OKI2018_I69.chr2.g7518.t1.cds [Oikopleura dioica]
MAAPLSPRSNNTGNITKSFQKCSLSGELVNFQILCQSTNLGSLTEKRYDKGLSIRELKGKLELITGCSPASMKLSLESRKGEKICDMDDDERLLGSYPVEDCCGIRVIDPESFDWSDLNKIEKQEMDDDTYDTFKPTSVKPTVREYKRIHKLGMFNPENQKKALEDMEAQEKKDKEARENFKVGQRCEVTLKSKGKQRGEVKFVGNVSFQPNVWIGIQLDLPYGKNNGTVEGQKYFECPNNFGVFAKPDSVEVGDFPNEEDDLFSSEDEI